MKSVVFGFMVVASFLTLGVGCKKTVEQKVEEGTQNVKNRVIEEAGQAVNGKAEETKEAVNEAIKTTVEEAENKVKRVIPTEKKEEAAQTVVKEISAKQWEFQPPTITVGEGDNVTLNITSQDVTHGFSIPDFNVNATLKPGEKTVVKFKASKKGTFTFACSVVCGAGHSRMKGTLVVE